MRHRHPFLVGGFVAVLAALPFAADGPITEKIDLDAVYRIKEEGLESGRQTLSERISSAPMWSDRPRPEGCQPQARQ